MIVFGNISYGDKGESSGDVTQQIADYVNSHPLYRTFNSWAALQAAAPTKTGERVYLSSYNAVSNGTFSGSGWLIGSLAGGVADDGGVHAANTAKTFYWTREKEAQNLDILDFGAVSDGTTDSMPAIIAMFKWGQTQLPRVGVYFPAGNFKVSTWDYTATYVSQFKMSGPPVEFGYFPVTRIILDGVSDFAFKVQARYTEITNLAIYGQYDVAANTTGFFKNTCAGGQYFRVSCIRPTYVGGKTFSLLDTLDTHFDQMYGKYLYDSFLYATWSFQTSGNWDHLTAIELSNFNFQYCYNKPVFDLQRATQCFIKNGWIEHSDNPGDLSNGQWLIDGLDIENCTQPLDLTYCRASIRGLNLINATMTKSNQANITQWQGTYDLGFRDDEAWGSTITGSMAAKWYSGALRGSNNQNSQVWLNLGALYIPNVGGIWEFEILCRNGYTVVGTGNYQVTNDRSPGKTIITVQRGTATVPTITMYHMGASAVLSAQFETSTSNTTLPSLWVQLSTYVGEYVVNVKSTSPTRFEQGLCGLYTPSGVTQAASPGFNAVTPRMSIHNGSAGVGAQGSLLAISSSTGTATHPITGATGYIQVVVNGNIVYMPYTT